MSLQIKQKHFLPYKDLKNLSPTIYCKYRYLKMQLFYYFNGLRGEGARNSLAVFSIDFNEKYAMYDIGETGAAWDKKFETGFWDF